MQQSLKERDGQNTDQFNMQKNELFKCSLSSPEGKHSGSTNLLTLVGQSGLRCTHASSKQLPLSHLHVGLLSHVLAYKCE